MADFENCMHCHHRKAVEGDHFCTKCGARFPPTVTEWYITDYFLKGYTYKEMLDFLNIEQNIKISLRTLKSNLKKYGLRRKKVTENIQVTKHKLQEELNGSSSRYGYRTMWQHLRQNHGLNVSRDTVMSLMRELDPDGVAQRKSRRLKRRSYRSLGPNNCWHVDGYDKMKPYGFPVHGCIDGFSRKILWLELVKSNNDPYTEASLYLKAIKELRVIPSRMRTDCGTENVVMAGIQSFLRRNHKDEFSEKTHIYGSSPLNQRIEAWWSTFRRNKSGYIIDFLKSIVESGTYNPDDDLQRACAWFCFAPLIKKELHQCKELWNNHYIRKSQYSEVPGRPNYLYCFPWHGFAEQGFRYSNYDLQRMQLYVDDNKRYDDDDDLYGEYFSLIARQINPESTNTFKSAYELYIKLINIAEP